MVSREKGRDDVEKSISAAKRKSYSRGGFLALTVYAVTET